MMVVPSRGATGRTRRCAVGKVSRRKRQQKGDFDPASKEARRQIHKVDKRGRKVGDTLTEYEALCAHGDDRVAQALIARYTQRMDRIKLTPDWQRLPIVEALGAGSVLDSMLYQLGANPARPPQYYGGSWLDRLGWGVDSCVAAIRLLLCGQVLGAAVVARTQLERWTFLRAESARLSPGEDEDTATYIARVWSTPDEFDAAILSMDSETDLKPSLRTVADADDDLPAHDHIVLSDGGEVCPALMWVALSELLHGRHVPAAVAWESVEMIENSGWTEDYALGVAYVCETVRLCLRQLRTTAAEIAIKEGNDLAAAILLSALDEFSASDSDGESRSQANEIGEALRRRRAGAGEDDEMPTQLMFGEGTGPNPRRSPSAIMFTGLTTPPLETLMPLTPNEGLHPEAVSGVYKLGRDFATVLAGGYPAGRKYRDDEYVTVAFGWHRSRSIRVALRALERERKQLGDGFNIHNLTGRSTSWGLVTETASLAARWMPTGEMQAAMFLMGSGLRSASWLWLEDDDRAMSVLRVVLEQCARLRTWRLKPARAAKLEANGNKTTPANWIEAAGWKRLRALNRALGEFAHAMPRSDWTGARELLAMLQDGDVDADKAIYTARGAALEFVTHLVADETTAAIRDLSPVMADNITVIFGNVGIELPLDAEKRFDHIWNHRTVTSPGFRAFNGAPGVPARGSALFKPRTGAPPATTGLAAAAIRNPTLRP